MYFWWDYHIKSFFFSNYTIKTIAGLVASCFGVACLTMILEFFKLLQAKQRQRELLLKSRQLRTICPSVESTTLLGESVSGPIIISKAERIFLHISDAILWLSTFSLSYIIMLAIMVYNGWITIGVILGGGVGYFIFGQTFMKINLQNCTILRETYCMLNCGEPVPRPRSR